MSYKTKNIAKSGDELINKLENSEVLKKALEESPEELETYLEKLISEKEETKEKVEYYREELKKINEGMIALSWELDKELEEKKKLAKSLKEHKGNLESLVEKRTEKIIETNQKLKAEIKERKKVEEALEQEKLKTQNYLNVAGAIILVINLNRKVELINEEGREILGETEENIIGRDWIDTFVKKSERKLAHDCYSSIVDKRIKRYDKIEYGIIGAKSEEKVVLWSHTLLLNEKNEPTGILCSGKDITERIEAERQIKRMNEILEQKVMQRTKELEATNEELESFSYSVSHDLRAPLRHIDGFAHLLTKRAKNLDDKSRHYVNSILESVAHMGNLIDKLLNLSRIGRKELNKTQFNMNRLVENVIDDVKEETKEREIKWNIKKLPDTFADRALIKQVLTNYISNALKYTSNEKVAKIEIGSYEKDNENVFYVKDNGAGFDMKYVDKLFGVFQRLHSDKEFKGVGIGLANIKRVITKHGGRVWAEGKVGEGATFYFSLPKEETNGNGNGEKNDER